MLLGWRARVWMKITSSCAGGDQAPIVIAGDHLDRNGRVAVPEMRTCVMAATHCGLARANSATECIAGETWVAVSNGGGSGSDTQGRGHGGGGGRGRTRRTTSCNGC